MNYFAIPGLKKEYIEIKRAMKKDVIIKVVCDHFKISKKNLCGNRRHEKFAHSRFIAFMLLYKYTRLTKTEIGDIFKKHHTSVIHGISKLKRLIEVNDHLTKDILLIEMKVKEF